MKEYVYVFMSATREKIKEKRKMLEDQNAKDTAHYIKESSDLERELCHQSCVQGFLNIKTIGCNNLNSGCRKGELKKKKRKQRQDNSTQVKQIRLEQNQELVGKQRQEVEM